MSLVLVQPNFLGVYIQLNELDVLVQRRSPGKYVGCLHCLVYHDTYKKQGYPGEVESYPWRFAIIA